MSILQADAQGDDNGGRCGCWYDWATDLRVVSQEKGPAMIPCEAFDRSGESGRCPQQATVRTKVEAQGQVGTVALCEQHLDEAWIEGTVEYWCGELIVTDPLIGHTKRLSPIGETSQPPDT